MLRYEEAEKRLEKFKIKNWTSKVIQAMGKLPAKLCEAGRALLGRNAQGKSFQNWDKQDQALGNAIALMEKLSAADRQRIFAVLFPKLAGAIEAAWQLLTRLPYETQYDRKGFRAPGNVAVHREARSRWLTDLISDLEGFDPDLDWLAAWTPYLSYGGGADSVGILLAAAIEAGGAEGDALFEILKESATGQHEIGRMGRHVTRALLVASKPEGWDFIEKLLLAAQRQEGLRQVILETVDEAHPEAFRRMLRLILDQNLIRYSSVVRAVDVWFGLQWTALTPAKIREALENVQRFLDDPRARAAALKNETGDALYLALWASGYEDAPKSVQPAAEILKDKDVERRFVAAHYLSQLDLPESRKALLPALDDEDLRIALLPLEGMEEGDEALFEPLKRLFDRMPAKPAELPALVWPWTDVRADRSEVADKLVDHVGKRPVSALIPYVPAMGWHGKLWMLQELAKKTKWDAATRDLLFTLVGERDGYLREQVLKLLKKCTVEEAEAQKLEGFLSRKNAEMRRGVLSLLVKQPTDAALTSSARLLASKKAEARLAGLELLRLLVEKKKGVAGARERAQLYVSAHPALTEHEQVLLDAILDVHRVVPTLDDALGLMNPAERSPIKPPTARKVALRTPTVSALLKSLDALIEKHSETVVKIEDEDNTKEELLGNLDWDFPSIGYGVSAQEDRKRLPLLDLWETWWEQRPDTLRDKDGLELARARIWLSVDESDAQEARTLRRKSAEMKTAVDTLIGDWKPPQLKHEPIVLRLIDWLLKLHPPEGETDFLLDATEMAFALVPEAELKRARSKKEDQLDWTDERLFELWRDQLEDHWSASGERWTAEQKVRFWELGRWREQAAPGNSCNRTDLGLLLAAYETGAANQADLLFELLGPREEALYGNSFPSLSQFTGSNPSNRALLQRRPELKALLERVRERVLEVELARGELPTAATEPALALEGLHGLDCLEKLLLKLDGKSFDRRFFSKSKAGVLTSLIRATSPNPEDTPEAFTRRMQALVKQKKLTGERVLELAFLAPRWLKHVEHFLGWPLSEGVWWFLAHVGGGRPDLDEGSTLEGDEKQGGADPWIRLLSERTPLTEEQIEEGAVDVAWFARVYAAIGPKRWQYLAAASKYGCDDNSYKKAVLLGEVLRGKANKRALIHDVKVKRLKNSVRLLGLLPLPEGAGRDLELHARFKVLQEYRRYARGLSPMSREDAVRSAEIGMENLARTAGYPDPIRLEWAMEGREIADLAAGPVLATAAGVTVTLSLDEQAQAQLTIQRGDKPLKAIPAAVRKDKKIAALSERRTDLKRQASRMRQSLEASMVRGDTFTGTELKQLFGHPLLVPMLGRLVLLGEGIRGFPVSGGQGLSDLSGKVEPIKPDEKLRIAHPHDLLSAGDWPQWQHHCFQTERVQPFKQLFRELYVVTAEEKKDRTQSHRYAGHQVNPRQAMALFGSRGWKTQDEVTRTFYDLGLTVAVNFKSGFLTPAEVEGLTLDSIEFRRKDTWKSVPLEEVPSRIFSEVMRDLDLVVSVAHVGGVDPEASASTVEMRALLLRETCKLLKIENYRIVGAHVVIDGQLGKYDVHLGSSIVHRQPGGQLCIVAVPAQHRGRIFLPFADDDPRTAEVLSKVILLARDKEIQDPGILDQLRS